MLPLAGTTCLIFGCGAIESGLRQIVADSTEYRLVLAVNTAARKHGIAPDVTFWQDGAIWPIAGEVGLTVRVACLEGPETGIKLPSWRCGLPEWPNPGRLYHIANTAAMAAVWAVSIGCELVAMLGCGCHDDGRDAGQLKAMRRDLDDVLTRYSDIRLVETMADWGAWKYEATGLKRIQYDPAERLRAFYR